MSAVLYFQNTVLRDLHFCFTSAREGTAIIIGSSPPVLQEWRNGRWNDLVGGIGTGTGTGTSGIPEAPADGKQYGRQSKQWTEIKPSGGKLFGMTEQEVKQMFNSVFY